MDDLIVIFLENSLVINEGRSLSLCHLTNAISFLFPSPDDEEEEECHARLSASIMLFKKNLLKLCRFFKINILELWIFLPVLWNKELWIPWLIFHILQCPIETQINWCKLLQNRISSTFAFGCDTALIFYTFFFCFPQGFFYEMRSTSFRQYVHFISCSYPRSTLLLVLSKLVNSNVGWESSLPVYVLLQPRLLLWGSHGWSKCNR